MITPDENGLIICPCCKKKYKPVLKRNGDLSIQDMFPNATADEREQLISGICSGVCFDEFLGEKQ